MINIFIRGFLGKLLFIFTFILSLTISCKFVYALELPENIFENALSKSRNGELSEALNLWNEFLQGSPDDAFAWSNRGNVRLLLGDPVGAIVDQTKSIELSPNEIDSHLNRGMAEELLKKWELAEKDYKWVLNQKSNNSDALYNLGNVRGGQGNWSQAKDLFEDAILIRPDFPMALSSKALAIYQLGDLDEAETELRLIIRKYPMFADARASLCALLWKKGLSGEAESHWAAAVGLDHRYKQKRWLLNIRRWPAEPVKDLMAFLALERL